MLYHQILYILVLKYDIFCTKGTKIIFQLHKSARSLSQDTILRSYWINCMESLAEEFCTLRFGVQV
jgi:hypothetical protein